MSAIPIPDIDLLETTTAARPDAPPDPKKGRAELPQGEGAPSWMVTFGDLMALSLTFFVLLFSMSEIEVEKLRAATESLQDGFGVSRENPGNNQPLALTQASDSVVRIGE